MRIRLKNREKRSTIYGTSCFGRLYVAGHRRRSREQIPEVLTTCGVILGRGTNVLISDDGVTDRVAINRISTVVFDGTHVYAGSGASLASLAAMCCERGLSGLEWACGIPGSVGGAAVMNAGAFGGDFASVAARVDVFRDGEEQSLKPCECGFGYRTSGFGGGDFASGGELSRVMLAVKNVLVGSDGVGTLIFDEIDTGVSGSAAGKIAVKLASVSLRTQVLCITHLSRIAAFADEHIFLSKSVENGKTFTRAEILPPDKRAAELARITFGVDFTPVQLSSGEQMIDEANTAKAELLKEKNKK